MCVYLLHFVGGRFGNERHSAVHYLGYAPEGGLEARLAEHRAGVGAAIAPAAVERGLSLEVVRVWPGEGRRDERRCKRWKKAADMCPLCRQARKGAA